MSLKLGNTNIAGTQILYSTTGNNTDGAMTQAITTTQLNLKANDADVVHKTGNESINGVKTFNNAINLANNTWNAVGDNAFIGDHNHSGCFCIKGNDGKTELKLFNRNEDVGLGFVIDEDDGDALKLISPSYSATAWGSVTAMTSIETNNNFGYIQFNHGLLIQFGLVTNMSNNTVWINFPRHFTAPPQVVTSSDNDRVEDGYNSYVGHVITTGFNVYNKMYGSNVNCWVHWIAIGY